MVAGLAGCEDDPVVQVGGPGPEEGSPSEPQATADASETEEGSALPEFDEEDFAEAEVEHRNPFRSFISDFKIEAPATVQRRVIMPDTTVDQMRLTAIIGRIPQARAMLVDTAGVGHVVRRGNYVGRAEVVQTGGADGMPVTLNWRVDRIRENEVVLAREDPTAPDRPPLTRVLTLYSEDELAQNRVAD
ncbi:MAG: pilus assembly protein PilP [Myxococcota bacterium]